MNTNRLELCVKRMCDPMQVKYDKDAVEVDLLQPAFTRRREVFIGRLAMVGFVSAVLGEVSAMCLMLVCTVKALLHKCSTTKQVLVRLGHKATVQSLHDKCHSCARLYIHMHLGNCGFLTASKPHSKRSTSRHVARIV